MMLLALLILVIRRRQAVIHFSEEVVWVFVLEVVNITVVGDNYRLLLVGKV